MWHPWHRLVDLFSWKNDDDWTGSSVDGENMKSKWRREYKELEGIVTGIKGYYGIIEGEILFTKDSVSGANMPLIGDKVKVRACRGNPFDTWRAMSVSICLSIWEDFDNWDIDNCESTEEERKRILDKKERRAGERLFIEKLLKDKFGVEIICENFGQLEVSTKKSLDLELRNQGSETQMLTDFYLIGSSQQVELGPLTIMEIDLKGKSKKLQEELPLAFEPGMTLLLKVICQAKYPGKESRTVVFEFSEFNIGRELTVDVTHSLVEYSGERTFFKSHALERNLTMNNKDLTVVPGPKYQKYREVKFFRQKLLHYQVPDNLRDCLLSGQDLTRILPCLKKTLNPSNYEARFKGLLHIEEIQQEIDIKDFDIATAEMEVSDNSLSLKVTGLSEGRPSIILGDRLIASKTGCMLSVDLSYEGVVHQVMKDAVLLKFSSEFHSTFDPSCSYSITFILNRISSRRCHRAIEIVSRLKDKSSKILFPMEYLPSMSQLECVGQNIQKKKFFNRSLNNRQRNAVMRIFQGKARPLPYIIYGPPGTGKTVTLVEAILQLQSNLPNAKILACAPSNSAADLLAERLLESGQVSKSSIIRLYAALRSVEAIPQTLSQCYGHVDDVTFNLEEKSIVVCTCTTAGNLNDGNNRTKCVFFTHLLIDEAGQATEPECMTAIASVASSVEQVVLAGDPQQLGPVLRSSIAKDYGLDMSYLERLSYLPLYQRNTSKFVEEGYDPHLITKLVDNYRCHPALIALPSQIFYNEELIVKGDSDQINCLSSWEDLPNKNNFPILFHGVRGADIREGNSPSWFNPHEVVLVTKYLSSLLSNDRYKISPNDIGIITPYRKQAERIRSMVESLELPKVRVGSVEEFQGQERLAIIISTVRSSESLVDHDLRHTLGFLDNRKRFNVAITRAQALLVVIGNPHVLCQDLYWSKLIEYCVDNGAYVGCDLPSFSFEGHYFNENRTFETL